MVGATLLIERMPGEFRAALLVGDLIVQVDHYRDREPPLAGAIFHGRVRRIEPGLGAAFVDLDGRSEGFLRARSVAGRPKGAPITTLLQEGASAVVRVLGEAPEGDDKLPRIATLDAAAVAALTAGGTRLPSAPACIDPGPPPVARILDEHAASAARFVCNDGTLTRTVRQWLSDHENPAVPEQQDGVLFDAFGVEEAIEGALARTVALPGGGSLVFEPGETLCAIDVNSGERPGRAGRAARDINLAAATEIARQLRLRELAGAIVIDFPNMERAADRDRLLDTLRTALAGDPAHCHVLGMTSLGLVEMTRQRRRPSLAARLLQPPAVRVPRPDAVAHAILRGLSAGSRRGSGSFVVCAAPPVIDLMNGVLAAALAESLSWSHAGIELRAEPAWPVGRYEIDGATGRGPSRT